MTVGTAAAAAVIGGTQPRAMAGTDGVGSLRPASHDLGTGRRPPPPARGQDSFSPVLMR